MVCALETRSAAPLRVIEVVVLPLGLTDQHRVLPPVDRDDVRLVLRPQSLPTKSGGNGSRPCRAWTSVQVRHKSSNSVPTADGAHSSLLAVQAATHISARVSSTQRILSESIAMDVSVSLTANAHRASFFQAKVSLVGSFPCLRRARLEGPHRE